MTETAATDQLEALERLRQPFPPEVIGKLPRGGIELDFVGHADLTDRLLSVDPFWSWEPVAFDEAGLPAIRQRSQMLCMWIRLTVCGVTRLGVGTCQDNKPEAEKELIGDALRNAAMRFGAALDLWSKSEHLESQLEPEVERDPIGPADAAELVAWFDEIGDKTERAAAKREFVGVFGRPETVERSAAEAAFRWVRDRVGADQAGEGLPASVTDRLEVPPDVDPSTGEIVGESVAVVAPVTKADLMARRPDGVAELDWRTRVLEEANRINPDANRGKGFPTLPSLLKHPNVVDAAVARALGEVEPFHVEPGQEVED